MHPALKYFLQILRCSNVLAEGGLPGQLSPSCQWPLKLLVPPPQKFDLCRLNFRSSNCIILK